MQWPENQICLLLIVLTSIYAIKAHMAQYYGMYLFF